MRWKDAYNYNSEACNYDLHRLIKLPLFCRNKLLPGLEELPFLLIIWTKSSIFSTKNYVNVFVGVIGRIEISLYIFRRESCEAHLHAGTINLLDKRDVVNAIHREINRTLD